MASPEALALLRHLDRSFLARCVRRFLLMEGIDRSLVLASQAFSAMIPLMIIASTLAPEGREDVVSNTLIRRFGLEGSGAEAVQQLFTIPAGATGSLSGASALLLLFSGFSFTRRMQRMYESAWGVPKGPAGLNALLGLVAIVVEIAVLYFARWLVRGLPADWLLMAPLSLAAGVVLWTSIPWLLLDRRVHWRRLLPAGAVAALATTVYGVLTTVYMPELVARYTAEFGLFGITVAIIGWLLVVSTIIVATSAIGAEFDCNQDPWVSRLKRRFNLDPASGLGASPVVGPRRVPTTQTWLTSPGDGPEDGEPLEWHNPVLWGRLLVTWLVAAAAVAAAAALVDDIAIAGGFLSLLWVTLLFGLVNAVLGPTLDLLALPLTVLTLGAFALVVNATLLMVTAWLTQDLAVGGFLSAVAGALIIAVVTTVLGFLLSPLEKRPGTGRDDLTHEG